MFSYIRHSFLHLHNIISPFGRFVKFCVYISILTPTRASGGLDWRAFRNGRLTSWLHQKRSYSLHHGNRSYFQDSKIREKLWAYDSSCVVYPLIEHYNKMPILAKLLLCQIQLSCRGYFRSSLLKWRTFLHHWYSGSRRG